MLGFIQQSIIRLMYLDLLYITFVSCFVMLHDFVTITVKVFEHANKAACFCWKRASKSNYTRSTSPRANLI